MPVYLTFRVDSENMMHTVKWIMINVIDSILAGLQLFDYNGSGFSIFAKLAPLQTERNNMHRFLGIIVGP